MLKIESDNICVEIRQNVAGRIGSNRFRTWFGEDTDFQLSDHGIDVVVANNFVGSWIANNFMSDIVAAAHDVLGGEANPAVRVVPRSTDDARPKRTPETAPVASSIGERQIPATPKRETPALRGTLDTFVVGPSNRLAHAAACSVARDPGASFRLLVIHGCCGLGKTHLLQGACNGFAQRNPALVWRYISGEEFTNQYIAAVQGGSIDQFRARFRRVDLLLIDDIHFLAGKRATQEEFLHTFDAVDTNGKAIVLTSDRHPRSIATLSEPLISRLISGMVVEVGAPDLETRREILRRRAVSLNYDVSPDVIEYIAATVTRNVRELEGALLKLKAIETLTRRTVTVELAREAMDDQVTAPALTSGKIVRIVAERFTVTPEQIFSRSRDRAICQARAVAMFLSRKHTKASYPELGREFGQKNHSTVLMAVQRVERALRANTPMVWKAKGVVEEVAPAVLIQEFERALFPPSQ